MKIIVAVVTFIVTLLDPLGIIATDRSRIVLLCELDGKPITPPSTIGILNRGLSVEEPIVDNEFYVPDGYLLVTFNFRQRKAVFAVVGTGKFQVWRLKIRTQPFDTESLLAISSATFKRPQEIREVWSLNYPTDSEPPFNSVFLVDKDPRKFTPLTYAELLREPVRAHDQKIELRVAYRYGPGRQEIFCSGVFEDRVRIQFNDQGAASISRVLKEKWLYPDFPTRQCH